MLANLTAGDVRNGVFIVAIDGTIRALNSTIAFEGVVNSQTIVNTLKTSELNTTHSITMRKNKFKLFVETIKNEGIKEPIKYVEYNGQKYVVDGHHRLQAAKQLGIKDVPVEKVELPYQGYKTVDDLFWGD